MVDPGHQILFYWLAMTEAIKRHKKHDLFDRWDGSNKNSPVWQCRGSFTAPAVEPRHGKQSICCPSCHHAVLSRKRWTITQDAWGVRCGGLWSAMTTPEMLWIGKAMVHASHLNPWGVSKGLTYAELDHGLHNSVSPLSVHGQGQLYFISAQQFTILPYYSIPDSLGDSLAPLSHPKDFGEEHNKSARLLPYSTRKSKTLILFTSHVLGARVHTTLARKLQLIEDLPPIPGPFCNVEPSMLRESECSQLPPENTQQGGLQFSKNLLNNSVKKICIIQKHGLFSRLSYILPHHIQPNSDKKTPKLKLGRTDWLNCLNNPRENFHQIQRAPCLSPQWQDKDLIAYHGFLSGKSPCSFSLLISAENSLITQDLVNILE